MQTRQEEKGEILKRNRKFEREKLEQTRRDRIQKNIV